MKMFQYIKDCIAPRKCYSCDTEGYFFCPTCLEKVEKHTPYCYICKEPSSGFSIHKSCQPACNMSQVLVYGKYTDLRLQKLIHDGKYYGKKEVFQDIGKSLAQLLSENHTIENPEEYIIIPTPMYFLRRWKRGYNHSDILAQEISQYLWVEYHNRVIKKKRHTKQQSHLERTQRLSNLKNAFSLNKTGITYITWKKVILIDDVISTWSTLNELSGLLKLYGAKEVIGLVIASD